jgi:D-3-phosphoglycerate dehydrogenase
MGDLALKAQTGKWGIMARDGRWRVLDLAETFFCPEALDPLREIADVISLPPSAEALAQHLPDCHAYLATLHARLTREIIETCPHLRVIATPTTGLDHLDMEAAAEHGITILSLKDDTEFLDSVTSTAEMTWALLLATVRRLPWSFSAAQRGEWARDRFRGHQLSGMTLGILGYGRLGRIVAQYGLAFRMKVIACDIAPVHPAPGVEMVDADTLLRESDIVSIHIHLTDETRGMFDAAAFARMKPTAYLLNTSRGAIVDEAAFLQALQSGQIAGAGVDVIEGEWRDDLATHPLIEYARTHENLVISPHTGGITFESQRMTIEHIVAKLIEHLGGLQ